MRPSSLPMLAACPKFVSGATEWTEPGTNRHKLFAELIRHKKAISDGIMEDWRMPQGYDADDIEACEWAADYFMLKAPLLDYPWYSEKKMGFLLPDFSTMEGTPDVVCGQDLFDLKTRERDYSAQMAAYALMIFEQHPEFEFVRVHILFTATRKVEFYTLTPNEAMAIVTKVLVEQDSIPVACEYCGWCANNLTCPALTSKAEVVAKGYADKAPEIDITNWHPSEMTTAEQIALGLTIWRKILKKWGESMEFHALDAATKKGLSLPGFKLTTTEGKQSCADVAQAFQLAGIEQSKFMQCCDLRMNTSKKYPERLGIVEVYAETNAMKKAPAKRELMAKLESVMKRGNPSQKLVAEKGDEEEIE